MPHTTLIEPPSGRRAAAGAALRRLCTGAECCRFCKNRRPRASAAFSGCAVGHRANTVKRMNTHTVTQHHPGAPRKAGRPGKYASGPVTERTMFRDGRPDRLLRLEEVFVMLGVARSTWDRWRSCGLTPPLVALPNGSLRVWESDLVRLTRTWEGE